MKRVRNRKIVHPDGMVEWLMVRVVTVGGVEQQLAVSRMLTRAERTTGRSACAMVLWQARRELRRFIARVVNT